MWFNEDENYIKSLTLGSGKRVMCVCPICGKEKSLVFNTANARNSTTCKGCTRNKRGLDKLLGKKFGRLLAISNKGYRKGILQILCRCDCGKETIVRASSLKNGNTKSCGCLAIDVNKARCGPLSSTYNHNLSDEQREFLDKQRHSGKTKSFRKAVKESDGNACVICDSEKQLVVHHLNGFKNNIDLRYDVDNGVTLCWTCHHSFHQNFMGGYKIFCTEQDFEDFLYQI